MKWVPACAKVDTETYCWRTVTLLRFWKTFLTVQFSSGIESLHYFCHFSSLYCQSFARIKNTEMNHLKFWKHITKAYEKHVTLICYLIFVVPHFEMLRWFWRIIALEKHLEQRPEYCKNDHLGPFWAINSSKNNKHTKLDHLSTTVKRTKMC